MPVTSQLTNLILRPRDARWARPALVARLSSGVIFVVFGLGKFTAHATEAASFHRYALPTPSAFVYVIGVLEIVGGLLLVAGLGVRPIALGLAGDMAGAITTAGRIDGGAINLALAPALLVVMLALVWAGGGERSLDSRLAERQVVRQRRKFL